MNYHETVNWMFQQLPMYQRQGKVAFKKDLTNTLKLAQHLKNPQLNFKSIHVAGTNGKGSVSHTLASVLQEANYKVGLYTSPHLKSYRERIKINGEEVSETFVVDFINRNKSFLEANCLSFFEMTVGMAFDYFSKNKVDVAVIEVGLGGRLDSTNIIMPELSVITNIGFDHTQFLGNSYEAIASEKAGIIKSKTPVVIGESQENTKPVFEKIADENNSQIYFADELVHEDFDSDLKGSYQKHNIKTVVQAIRILNKSEFNISQDNLIDGLSRVKNNTGLQGRWQVLGTDPKIICDTGHNLEALSYIFNQIKSEKFIKLHIVFGVVNDKNISSILPIMPKEAEYYFCKPNVPRGLDAEILQAEFLTNQLNGFTFPSAVEALEAAKERASKTDLIFVGGSNFVVAEVI